MKTTSRISIVIGNLPEINIISPVFRTSPKNKVAFSIYYTWQFYLNEMDKTHIKERSFHVHDFNLDVNSRIYAVKLWAILCGIKQKYSETLSDSVDIETNLLLLSDLISIIRTVEGMMSSFRIWIIPMMMIWLKKRLHINTNCKIEDFNKVRFRVYGGVII